MNAEFTERRVMSETESRLTRLEVMVEAHKAELQALRDSGEVMEEALVHINTTLTQIKYGVLGALGVVVCQSLGLDETIKLLLHVVVA